MIRGGRRGVRTGVQVYKRGQKAWDGRFWGEAFLETGALWMLYMGGRGNWASLAQEVSVRRAGSYNSEHAFRAMRT